MLNLGALLNKKKSLDTSSLMSPMTDSSVGYKSTGDYTPKWTGGMQVDKVKSIKEAIKYNESRGEEIPYSFYQPSGDKNIGDVLGAYQISEAKLKENAKRFLGKDVTRQEFLANPSLQEKFVESEIKFLLDNNFSVESILGAHRGGWSDMSRQATVQRNNKYKDYISSGMPVYNQSLLGGKDLNQAVKKPVIDQNLKLEQGNWKDDDWYDKLTEKVRSVTQNIPVIKDISQVLFGTGKEEFTKITGLRPEVTSGFGSDLSISDQMLMKGLIGFFGIDFLTRTQQEKITLAGRQLKKDGATDEEALIISTEWAKATKEERAKLKENLPNNLRKSLDKRETMEGLGVLSDIVSIVPIGKLSKTGTKSLKLFLEGADDIGDISRALKQAGFADDLIAQYAPKFAKTQDVKFIDDALKSMQKLQETTKIIPTIEKGIEEVKPNLLPAVIQGDTFILGTSTEATKLDIKALQKLQKQQIKATQKEIKNAKIAQEKALKLELKQQEIRQEAIENINRFKGNVENVRAELKAKNLSDEDIANIVLEDGTKLEEVAKIKRNSDKSLSTYITKAEIDDIAKTYTDEIPKQKWEKKSILADGVEVPAKLAKSIELPYAYFERKGLNQIYEPIIQAGRDAEIQKQLFLKKFKDAGLYKKGGWLTANSFDLSKSEAEGVAKYYLGRQGKTQAVELKELTPKSQKFVEVFDSIIKDTEEQFYEVAKKMGKNPGKVENYAPLMTSKDIKLIDEGGAMDWLFRNHPSFFSLKERVKNAPLEVYELDYREVVARWLDGITQFLNYGETTNDLKYLVNSDQFKSIVKEQDWQVISKWLQDITTPEKPVSMGGQAVTWLSQKARKGVAVGSLGLNYSTVVKQALTQIPLSIIEKAPPKFKSEYAKAFGINVADLPSITKRSGDIAISDLQGKLGRIFTGSITEFDRINAQMSLNALLDKEYNKFLKEGVEISPEIQKIIEKKAQDTLDMWYGGFFKGQRPEAFRKELGNFLLMFLYPMTSQLNGFYRAIGKAKGWSKIEKGAEVLTAVTAIAYMEQVIENLSPQWSDEKGMTQDVLQSMAGNIPIVSDIAYSLMNEQELSISPVIGNINNIVKNLGKDEMGKAGWAIAETFGLPKQIRRIKEGMQIMEEGGITDSEGKMLAPVQDAMELIRSFLRGKYGSIASKDWIRNIGEKSEDRRWFVPQVEFLQNGDYARKAELYQQFSEEEQKELYDFLSEGQQKKLDSALAKRKLFNKDGKQSLESIFK